jgi:drug/metabolite transporter (DMT)-like permease
MSCARALALLVIAAASWGAATAAGDHALEGMTAIDLLLLEVLVAAAILWLPQPREPLPRVRPRPAYLLLGGLEPALAFLLINLGLERTSAGVGSLLIALEGVFVALLATVLLRERVARATAIALALGIGGAALVAAGQDGGESTIAGNLLVVAGTLAAAGYVVLARRLAGSAPALEVTRWQFAFAALLVTPVAAGDWLTRGSGLGAAGLEHWLAALLAAALGGAVAFVLYNVAIERVRASTAGAVLNLIPVFGLIAAVGVLGERVESLQLVGGVMIITGLYWLARAATSSPATPSLGDAPGASPAEMGSPGLGACEGELRA